MKKGHLNVLTFSVLIFIFLILGALLSSWGINEWISDFQTNNLSTTEKGIYLIFFCSLAMVTGAFIICKIVKKPLLPKLKDLWKILGTSVLVTLVYNHYIFSYSSLITTCVFSVAAGLILSYAVMRRFFVLFWFPMFCISCIQIGCYYQYGTTLNSFLLQETLHANANEVANFMNWQNISLIVTALLITIVILWLIYRSLRNSSTPSLLFAGSCSMLLFCLSCFCMHPVRVNIASFWPAYELRRVKEIFGQAQAQEAALLSCVQHLPSAADKESSISTLKPDQGVVFILHIGESVRSDRLGINGWKNDTTPYLASRKELINYPNCVSAAPSTCSAFITLLTDATWDVQAARSKNDLPTTGSVLDLFAANGFTVAAFIHSGNVPNLETMDINTKTFDSTFAHIFQKLTTSVTHTEKIGNLSMEQSGQIQHYCSQNPNKNLLLLVNNMGSHGPFRDYDHSNPRFTPSNHKTFYSNAEENATAVNNAYDNTIAYTDELIGKICESLKGRPFVYIYVGDHGEYLGENGMWSRAALKDYSTYPTAQACLVPLIVAYSPEFENLHPHFSKSLAQLRSNSSLTIGQGHLFHTLLGLFGISTEYYDSSWDLTSPQVKPHEGPRPAGL